MWFRRLLVPVIVALAAAGCRPAPTPTSSGGLPSYDHGGLPSYDHIVVVVEENHSYGEIVGNAHAPYLTSLGTNGATMTQSFAVTHPSEPNYLALFSGSTQGLANDSCPHTYSTENLGHQLITAGQTFAGYSESMPSPGYSGCVDGRYARKHSPWVNFTNVPSSSNLRFADFPTDYARLPRVSIVAPDLCHDMHDCSVSAGDTWLKNNLGGYATWAKTHNSLLVVTFDEDDRSADNRIPTIFFGTHVATGGYSERITHYTVLRTLQSLTGVACTGNSCAVSPITGIWN